MANIIRFGGGATASGSSVAAVSALAAPPYNGPNKIAGKKVKMPAKLICTPMPGMVRATLVKHLMTRAKAVNSAVRVMRRISRADVCFLFDF